MWRCPLCQRSLHVTDKFWHCDNNHNFDKAKSGYVNLLPVQNKNSKEPGDDKHMLSARRDFHDTQGYVPLMAALATQIRQCMGNKDNLILFEAGCGEGAYIRYLKRALASDYAHVTAAANDIAKIGVEKAAKADKYSQYVVASSYNLPLVDHTVDVMLEVFAPGRHEEYARLLSDEGILITVDPGPDHLFEFKQHIYDNPQKHVLHSHDESELAMTEQKRVTFTVDLADEKRRSGLLGMTPLFWKLQPDRRRGLQRAVTQVTADFIIRLWRRHL